MSNFRPTNPGMLRLDKGLHLLAENLILCLPTYSVNHVILKIVIYRLTKVVTNERKIDLKRYIRKSTWIVAALALTSTLPLIGLAAASTGSAIQAPPVPAAGSTIATWQSWASALDAQLQSQDPSTLVPVQSGCTQSSVSLTPVVSSGLGGIPKGIVTEAITVTGSCIFSQPVLSASSSANAVS